MEIMPQLIVLAREIEARGFVCRARAWGESQAVWATTPVKETADGLRYFEGSVVVYPKDGGWEACVPKYGGALWIMHATTPSELVAAVTAVLSNPTGVLDGNWRRSEDKFWEQDGVIVERGVEGSD